jgi:hypothetical protein
MTDSLVSGPGWFPVLVGIDDESTVWDRTVVAKTEMSIHCANATIRRRCVDALKARETDQLCQPPELRAGMRLASVRTRSDPESGGGVIAIRAVWFDEDCFVRQAARLGQAHTRVFLRIGLRHGDVQIRHWRPVDIAVLSEASATT